MDETVEFGRRMAAAAAALACATLLVACDSDDDSPDVEDAPLPSGPADDINATFPDPESDLDLEDPGSED